MSSSGLCKIAIFFLQTIAIFSLGQKGFISGSVNLFSYQCVFSKWYMNLSHPLKISFFLAQPSLYILFAVVIFFLRFLTFLIIDKYFCKKKSVSILTEESSEETRSFNISSVEFSHTIKRYFFFFFKKIFTFFKKCLLLFKGPKELTLKNLNPFQVRKFTFLNNIILMLNNIGGAVLFILYFFFMPLSLTALSAISCSRSSIDSIFYNNYQQTMVCDFKVCKF